MNKLISAGVFGALLLALSPNIYANNNSVTGALSIEDTVGVFAAQGYVGSKAGQKSVSQANAYCLSKSSDGSQQQVSTDSDFYSTFKGCMKDFVPFSESGDGSLGSCLTATVSWGQCSGVASGGPSGVVRVLANTAVAALSGNEYEGTGEFRCANSVWQFTGGGCKRNPDACEANMIESWAVTSPAWADEDPSTVHHDRYGQVRNTPKSRCVGVMPASESGKLTIAKISMANMAEPSRYGSAGTAPKRCFDGDWLDQPEEGASRCDYIPKSCAARTVAHDGCTFTIPALAHNAVYVDSSPLPTLSVGAVEAYCWDGQLEIKNQTCKASCSGNISSSTWLGADPRACGHVPYNQASNIRSGGTILVNNDVIGMTGNAVYSCEKGTITTSSTSCAPSDCTAVNSASWGGENNNSCSHSAKTGLWKHGETYVIDTETDPFSTQGTAYYKCQYGGLSRAGDGALDFDASMPATCVDVGSTAVCVSEEAVVGGGSGTSGQVDQCGRFGWSFSNGMCCTTETTPSGEFTKKCYEVP